MSDPVLVIGIPRSGTTWLCEVLSLAREHEIVFEPDNEKTSWLGWRLKRHLPRFPTLSPNDPDPHFGLLWDYAFRGRHARALTSRGLTWPLRLGRGRAERAVARKEGAAAAQGAHDLTAGKPPMVGPRLDDRPLWDKVLFGGRRQAVPRIVKSVHIPFCAEWVAQQSAPAKVVVVFRHPFGVIASLRRMALDDAFREGSLSRHLTESERAMLRASRGRDGRSTDLRPLGLMVLKMYEHLEAAAARNSDWTSIRFESLCAAPAESFLGLFERLGIPWSPAIEAGIESRNRPGEGFKARRVAREQIDGWKRSLSAREIEMLNGMFAVYLAGSGLTSGSEG